MKTAKKDAIRQRIQGKVSEPSYAGTEPVSDGVLLSTLRWYHDNKDDKYAAKILGCDVYLARKYITLAWAKRMVQRGFVINEKLTDTMNRMAKELDAERKAAAPKPVVDGATMRERIEEGVQARVDSYISDLEGMIDDYVLRPKLEGAFNSYEWMQKNGVKAVHAKAIGEYFREWIKEPLLAASGKDPELAEAYRTNDKKHIRDLLAFVANIVKDAERLTTNQKVSRKPRAKKKVSADKVVSKMKYKVSDDTFKVKSVDPTQIPGCDQLWVFNTKTRKLGVYRSVDASGLTVKGTSIVGFSEKESVAKTLRKPEKVLERVVSGGKLVLRKVLDEINSKESPMNGRINGDVILLRVVK